MPAECKTEAHSIAIVQYVHTQKPDVKRLELVLVSYQRLLLYVGTQLHSEVHQPPSLKHGATAPKSLQLDAHH